MAFQLRHSVDLESINLTVSGVASSPNLAMFCKFLFVETVQRRNNLVALKYLSIRATDIQPGHGVDVPDVIEMRAGPNSVVARLQELTLSECLVPRQREDRLREVVDKLMIEYD